MTPESPPWGFIEYATSVIGSAVAFVGTWLLRQHIKVSQHTDDIAELKADMQKTAPRSDIERIESKMDSHHSETTRLLFELVKHRGV